MGKLYFTFTQVETFVGLVNKFYEEQDSQSGELCAAHPTFSCRTHASRRPGFYITNIFVVMVTSIDRRDPPDFMNLIFFAKKFTIFTEF